MPIVSLRLSLISKSSVPRPSIALASRILTMRQARHGRRLIARNSLERPRSGFLRPFPAPNASPKEPLASALTKSSNETHGSGPGRVYRSHIDKVSLTNGTRFVWPVSEYDEEISYHGAYYGVLKGKYKYPDDGPVIIMVQNFMTRLLEVELARGPNVKHHVFQDYDDPNAPALPTRVFINTGYLLETQNLDEVAGTLAHELGHTVARHAMEKSICQFFANTLSKFFGCKGPPGRDYITSKTEARLTHLKSILFEAEVLYEDNKRVPLVLQEWEELREDLKDRATNREHPRRLARETMPAILLPVISQSLIDIKQELKELKRKIKTRKKTDTHSERPYGSYQRHSHRLLEGTTTSEGSRTQKPRFCQSSSIASFAPPSGRMEEWVSRRLELLRMITRRISEIKQATLLMILPRRTMRWTLRRERTSDGTLGIASELCHIFGASIYKS
ncbi:uncharacterized protein PAC_10731 [Phialocephala subalpina]|uniref:Peptidase M48 domain-containing protein n=1 Tax=Phialocephala subalpina TaxID=576137 RepID=A0A1L7X729_9HELO|nr:uncharacterized protein PAC_10731 [Phialocephala subalpina]